MTIGPLLSTVDLEEIVSDIEEHGSFFFFNNNPGYGQHYLRCVVWRDEETGNIIGHNFDYYRSNFQEWWSEESAESPEEAAALVHFAWRAQALSKAIEFREKTYPGLIAGTVELDEIKDRDE